MRMNWFRVYHEARNDAKLRTLSDRQFRVWFNLLCVTSEQEDRGMIEDFPADLLSIEVASGDDELLTETLRILCKLRIIRMSRPQSVTGVTGVTLEFIHFDDRQYDKPSDMPEATAERKRQQRERDKLRREAEQIEHADVSNKEGVTPGHAPSHPEKRREEEIRGEKNDSARNAPASFWPELWAQIEVDLGHKPTWNYGAETDAVKRLLKVFPEAPPSEFAAFLAYKRTCFGVDPAGQVSFVKYGRDFGAWKQAGMPDEQKANGHGPTKTAHETRVENATKSIAADLRQADEMRARRKGELGNGNVEQIPRIGTSRETGNHSGTVEIGPHGTRPRSTG